MKRIIIAAALLAASLSASGEPQTPLTEPGRLYREPLNPSFSIGDGRGAQALALQFDGIKLFGESTLSFSPRMSGSMAMPVGQQAGWAIVRVGNDFFAMPLFHLTPLDSGVNPK